MLQVVDAQSIAEKVEQSILKHASVTVTTCKVSNCMVAFLARIQVLSIDHGGRARNYSNSPSTVMIARFHFEFQVELAGAFPLETNSFAYLGIRALNEKNKRLNVHVPRGDGVQAMLRTPTTRKLQVRAPSESCHSVEQMYEMGRRTRGRNDRG